MSWGGSLYCCWIRYTSALPWSSFIRAQAFQRIEIQHPFFYWISAFRALVFPASTWTQPAQSSWDLRAWLLIYQQEVGLSIQNHTFICGRFLFYPSSGAPNGFVISFLDGGGSCALSLLGFSCPLFLAGGCVNMFLPDLRRWVSWWGVESCICSFWFSFYRCSIFYLRGRTTV